MEEEEYDINSYREKLCTSLQIIYGKNKNTIEILNSLIENAEYRIARRIKDDTHLLVYKKYIDVIYQMVKLDYNELGAEGEISRDANGVSFKHTTSRPSNEILATIPQVL